MLEYTFDTVAKYFPSYAENSFVQGKFHKTGHLIEPTCGSKTAVSSGNLRSPGISADEQPKAKPDMLSWLENRFRHAFSGRRPAAQRLV
jgi:hypothetical protein